MRAVLYIFAYGCVFYTVCILLPVPVFVCALNLLLCFYHFKLMLLPQHIHSSGAGHNRPLPSKITCYLSKKVRVQIQLWAF